MELKSVDGLEYLDGCTSCYFINGIWVNEMYMRKLEGLLIEGIRKAGTMCTSDISHLVQHIQDFKDSVQYQRDFWCWVHEQAGLNPNVRTGEEWENPEDYDILRDDYIDAISPWYDTDFTDLVPQIMQDRFREASLIMNLKTTHALWEQYGQEYISPLDTPPHVDTTQPYKLQSMYAYDREGIVKIAEELHRRHDGTHN
jgi:hypothetical protein